MTAHIVNTSALLFHQLKTLAERKNLQNVRIHCSNGIIHHNKLLVGLVFPILKTMEEFSMIGEVVLIIPGKSVQNIMENIDLFFESFLNEEKSFERESDNNIEESSELESTDNLSQKEAQIVAVGKVYIKEEYYVKEEDEELFDCNNCGKRFQREIDAQHHCEILFSCNLCEGVKGTKREIRRHMRTIHGEDDMSGKSGYCMECNKTVGQLRAHTKRVHMQIKNHYCTYCERGFFDKRDLGRHISDRHEGKKEVCQECGLEVKRLHTHMDRIHRKKSFPVKICPDCGKSVQKLEEHLKAVHEKVKNYSCPICPYEVYRRTTLDAHLAVHEKYSALNKAYVVKDKQEHNPEDVAKAAEHVMSGNMSRRKAAEAFNVSRRSIRKSCNNAVLNS